MNTNGKAFGRAGKDIIFNGPGREDLELAIREGVRTIDHLDELT